MTDTDIALASAPDARGYCIPGENLNFSKKYKCNRCGAEDLIWKFKDLVVATKKAKWCLHSVDGRVHRCAGLTATAPTPPTTQPQDNTRRRNIPNSNRQSAPAPIPINSTPPVQTTQPKPQLPVTVDEPRRAIRL